MRILKPILNKRLIPLKNYKGFIVYLQHALLFLLASFFLAGCASKPWTDPLKSTEADSTIQIIDTLVARNAKCGGTLEADISLFYQNPLEKKALSGYLQFSKPSSYKFVMTNPFGQPIIVVAGDKESFQAINTLDKKYLDANLSSFGLRNDIPSDFLKSDWNTWLTGRNELSSQSITDIRNDRDSRGVWLTFQSKEQNGVYHLLLDREQEIFLVLVLEDGRGKSIAEISYDNWVTLEECKQPQEIDITGLDYWTKVQIKLSNVLITSERKTFQLKPPPGFLQQYLR
jgi:outer membrane biogenesis lipoprotein LolB